MYFRTPRLEIYPDRIAANARSVIGACHAHGAVVACVAKVVCAHPAVVRALEEAGADQIADSRVQNLESLSAVGDRLPRLLLRAPTPSQAYEVVRCADITLNTSLPIVRVLSDAAVAARRRHQVIIMVDVGDLREGVWPDQAPELVRRAAALPNIDVIGVGANLACYGGVIPTVANMRSLIAVRDACRESAGLELAVLSGGNSSSLPLLTSGQMPAQINHFRIGETIVLGRNVLDRSPWPGARQDTFTVVAEVIELERKPSVPIGPRAQNAFGETAHFPDRGTRRRAICNIGRQDTSITGLTPVDEGVIVLGGSSDHLILDVQDAHDQVRLGSEVAFYPDYAAVLALSTSPYVQKAVVRD
jgi:predicted amino acid racemase